MVQDQSTGVPGGVEGPVQGHCNQPPRGPGGVEGPVQGHWNQPPHGPQRGRDNEQWGKFLAIRITHREMLRMKVVTRRYRCRIVVVYVSFRQRQNHQSRLSNERANVFQSM